MTKLISSFTLAAISASACLVFPQVVVAEEITCQGSIGAITVDNIKVPQGATCSLRGTTVKGNVVVNSRATLMAIGASINGSIQAEGAAFVDVNSNTTVGGSIQVVQGQRARIVNTRINADLQYNSNRGTLVANNNQIGGSLQAFQNTGGLTIRQNRINGNLQCKENIPASVGGGNIVNGNKEDQCAQF